MPFEKLKSSIENLWNNAMTSDYFKSIQRLASETGAGIDDNLKSVSQSLSAFASTEKPSSEGHASGNANISMNFESRAALKPIQKLVSEAGSALDDKARTLLDSDIPELLGAAGGVGAGVAAGAGILTVGAASGTAGAAALTSGLAAAGGLVGGGMIAGIGVVAAPAVVLGAGGVWAVAHYNRNKLSQAKETLLQEAIRKRDAVLKEVQATTSSNRERVDYLSSLVAQLQAAVENLKADVAAKKPQLDAQDEKGDEAE
jgi:outer membrane murein-binding lipoprotein Lpp